MHTLLIALLVLISVVLIFSVLMQPSKTQGFGSAIAQTSDTFYSKNKSRTKEALMAKITVVTAILFAIVVVALSII